MSKKPTSEQIAKLFGVPVENVEKQFAKNAKQLRTMAKKGDHRGYTAKQLTKLASEAEAKANPKPKI
jgi:hypothetical protein